jgi:type VI secretion system secreted protein Hcp
VLLPLTGWSAFDAYLKIEGIPGEATEAKHQGWIEVLGVTNALVRTTAPETPGPLITSELSIVKYVDKASPKLLLACAGGTNIPSIQLEFITTNASKIRFYEIVLSNVVARSANMSGSASSAGTKMPEQCRLTFQQIRWTYTEVGPVSQLPKSILTSYWDLLENTGGSFTNLSVFKVTGIQKGPKQVLLSWQAEGDKTYQVYCSPQVDGAFSPLAQVTATSDSVMTYTVPIITPALFFVVEELP